MIHKMWRMLRTLENPLWKRHYFVMIFSKKVLDKGGWLWYYSQARPSESEGKSEANLENDTEKKRARNSAKIPKSLDTKVFEGLNGRV